MSNSIVTGLIQAVQHYVVGFRSHQDWYGVAEAVSTVTLPFLGETAAQHLKSSLSPLALSKVYQDPLAMPVVSKTTLDNFFSSCHRVREEQIFAEIKEGLTIHGRALTHGPEAFIYFFRRQPSWVSLTSDRSEWELLDAYPETIIAACQQSQEAKKYLQRAVYRRISEHFGVGHSFREGVAFYILLKIGSTSDEEMVKIFEKSLLDYRKRFFDTIRIGEATVSPALTFIDTYGHLAEKVFALVPGLKEMTIEAKHSNLTFGDYVLLRPLCQKEGAHPLLTKTLQEWVDDSGAWHEKLVIERDGKSVEVTPRVIIALLATEHTEDALFEATKTLVLRSGEILMLSGPEHILLASQAEFRGEAVDVSLRAIQRVLEFLTEPGFAFSDIEEAIDGFKTGVALGMPSFKEKAMLYLYRKAQELPSSADCRAFLAMLKQHGIDQYFPWDGLTNFEWTFVEEVRKIPYETLMQKKPKSEYFYLTDAPAFWNKYGRVFVA